MVKNVKLGELGKVVSGSTPKTNIKEYWDGNILWITPAEIKENDYYILDTQRKITDIAVKKTNLKLLPKGTVLLSSRAPIGKVAICGSDMYCNQGFKNVICSEKLENRYLYYFFKHNIDYIKSLGRGATFKEISKGIVQELQIPYRRKEEQIEISNKLDKIEEILKLRRQQIVYLNKIINLLFVEMFGTIYNNKNKYEIKTLKEVFKLIKDGTHNTPDYTKDSVNGIKFLSAKDVVTGKINWDNIKYITFELHKILEKRVKPQKGDILLAKNGTIGVCAKVENDEIFDIYVSLALLRPKEGYSVEYLVQAINNDVTSEQFNRRVKGIGVPNLHLGEIEKTKIIVPPIKYQNKFAEIVKQINRQKFIIEENLEQMKLLQKSLMNQFF